VELRINGGSHAVDAPLGTSLAEALRDLIGLTGTKVACDEGHCGACTVLLDGEPVLSCITLVHRIGGREVTTIEGLREHPMVDAFVRADAVQCGYCTPGQIVSAVALVEANPEPSRDEIRHWMAGNLCRCGTYPKIEEAILGVGSTEPTKSGGAGSAGTGAETAWRG
jgi:aerobic-type carbon monoxide dehydrogenase small subunit (CoxS/CutS family)